MTTSKPIFTLMFLCCISLFPQRTLPQSDCLSVHDIEDVNKGKLSRTAHIKGENAILFIVLDPSLSAPEFDYDDNYRDEHFIESVKRLRQSLYSSGIDEVVVWQLPFPSMGVAVPFKRGCAIEGYGEPDYHEKLMLMHTAFLEITKHGLDASSTRARIKKLLQSTRYKRMYKDEMVDIMINNLRPLMVKAPNSDHGGEESRDFSWE